MLRHIDFEPFQEDSGTEISLGGGPSLDMADIELIFISFEFVVDPFLQLADIEFVGELAHGVQQGGLDLVQLLVHLPLRVCRNLQPRVPTVAPVVHRLVVFRD